jgi:hypothetical protein
MAVTNVEVDLSMHASLQKLYFSKTRALVADSSNAGGLGQAIGLS